ncbi:FAD/NAD(P)-binding domain-containing protein [Peniophora sp. CONT]|nr:FAD/NAD(P)-binding domain-containing protein [Peniophora sp. CONT]
MTSPKDFTVAVVGGGIVGLTCAIALARAGVDVDVFEAASKYGDVGAGIGLGANALRVLKDVDILDDIMARSESLQAFQNSVKFVRGTEPHDTIYEHPNEDNMEGLAFHRAAFLAILASILPSNVRSHFNKRCITVSEARNGRVQLSFADNSVHEVDLVIGADGIKSAVRTQVFGAKDDRLVNTGTSAYRALIPTQRLKGAGVKDELLQSEPRCYLGQEKHIIALSIMGGSVLNLVAFTTDFAHAMIPAGPQASWPAWVAPATQEEVLADFEDFGPDVRHMLESTEDVNKWSIHGLYPPLECHVSAAKADGESKVEGSLDKCNVVLVGDSAHAMLPHMGAGASVGIEGAYVLKSLLLHPQTQRTNLSDVLRAYSTVRVPRAHFVATSSKHVGDVYEGHGPSGPSDAQRRRDLERRWDAVWGYDAQAEVARAVEILEESGVFQRN